MHRTGPLLLVVLVLTSGCLGVVTGDTVSFEADPAAVSESAVSEHGFQLTDESTASVERNADLPVVGSKTVHITNHFASYERVDASSANASAAAFVVASTPRAEVAGQGTNPLGRVPLEEVVDRFGDRAGAQSNGDEVDTTTRTVLGTETAVKKFAATTEVKGQTVETYVYVTRVAHEGDYVIAVGVLPQSMDDESAIYGMMEAIEHPA